MSEVTITALHQFNSFESTEYGYLRWQSNGFYSWSLGASHVPSGQFVITRLRYVHDDIVYGTESEYTHLDHTEFDIYCPSQETGGWDDRNFQPTISFANSEAGTYMSNVSYDATEKSNLQDKFQQLNPGTITAYTNELYDSMVNEVYTTMLANEYIPNVISVEPKDPISETIPDETSEGRSFVNIATTSTVTTTY